MGILNQLWWVIGLVMALPLIVPGVGLVADGSAWGALLVVLGLLALFLPEYIRWRLLGGSSPLERVPGLGPRPDGEE
jgi:hypothetical protein